MSKSTSAFRDRRVAAGYAGVLLKQWYTLAKFESTPPENIVLDILPHSKYGRACTLAMGRPWKSDESPVPQAFENKIFRVDVGWSSRDSGGSFSARNVGRKKDPRDYLRIHTILEKIEEKAPSHMTHMNHMAIKHEHALEHDHEHDTRALASAQESESTQTENIGLRMTGASKTNEQVPQGHADQAPGMSERKGITESDVLRTWPGAKVSERRVESVEQQFELVKGKKSAGNARGE